MENVKYSFIWRRSDAFRKSITSWLLGCQMTKAQKIRFGVVTVLERNCVGISNFRFDNLKAQIDFEHAIVLSVFFIFSALLFNKKFKKYNFSSNICTAKFCLATKAEIAELELHLILNTLKNNYLSRKGNPIIYETSLKKFDSLNPYDLFASEKTLMLIGKL